MNETKAMIPKLHDMNGLVFFGSSIVCNSNHVRCVNAKPQDTYMPTNNHPTCEKLPVKIHQNNLFSVCNADP